MQYHLMLQAGDLLSENLQTWCCSCVGWQVIPIGYCTGYKAILDELLSDYGELKITLFVYIYQEHCFEYGYAYGDGFMGL